ncbi:ABC transporter ATP-binding protein [Desulfonauticus submarinus]|uniref:ABC-2 type transport system ATP-binding protein n=1 Tax=Desulfonauticus submarinus TaxID=206665 RepID=A0A1H0B5H3_9BACT|nr:ATP-binding cassette domain-containing protein [Desulfonauticus submarinus]SDN40889.1 ABC-2 type transport system ATP-binding protein [Desulfonauticus submarinus]
MLRVQGIDLSYGTQQVLFNLNFNLHQGEILGFLGPNGAGKSSTMRILTGYLRPSKGEVFFLDKDVSKNPLFLREHLGYLPETAPIYPELKVEEYLKWVAEVKSVENINKEVDKVIRECGLKTVQKKLIRYLSKGYRQRVGLAQALLGDPKLIILDEPTVGLDPTQVREIRNLIKELGKEKTILLSTHILSEVELLCKRVIIINRGRILADESLEELVKKAGEKRFILLLSRKTDLNIFKEEIGDCFSLIELKEVTDGYKLELSQKREGDFREKIFAAAIKSNGVLLELFPKRSSLEEAFVKLVYSGEEQ